MTAATAIAERVRSLVPNRDAEKLAVALVEIRRRDARRQEIEAKWGKRVRVDYFVERLAQAESDYERTESDEDLERACLAECALEKARLRAGFAQMQTRVDIDIVGAEFNSEFPDNRSLLTKACGLRLKLAKTECERITSATEKRLTSEGFSADEIAKWPAIREARRVVELFSDILEALPTKPVEKLWRAADTLLE
jgi:hypothetical protein